jgi:DNA-binding transcriptional LysR family regulator
VYDPVLLRTFVFVASSLSFTQAAADLGLRQPTVSQHIRRLEDEVGRPLLVRTTRTVRLTADGEAMESFARAILAAHDRAVSYFTGSGLSGRLRFGVTDDVALTSIPSILRDFKQIYPRIDLELTVAQNEHLHRRLESGHLDLAFVQTAPGDHQGQLVRRDRLVWTAVPGTDVELNPLPLVAYQPPNISRSLAVQALEGAGIPYRITCTVRSVLGALAAVRAGLGIATFARSLIPADLGEIADRRLPELSEIDFILLTNPSTASASAEALAAAIVTERRPTLATIPVSKSPPDRTEGNGRRVPVDISAAGTASAPSRTARLPSPPQGE